MSFDLSEIMAKLQEIEGFAAKVSETKVLADELAANLAKLKSSVNKTIEDAFTEVANQIDTLRKNMEQMESVKPSAAPTAPTPAPAPTPAAEPAAEPAADSTPAPAAEPAPAPAADPTPAPAAEVVPEPPKESDDQLDFLLQQKDRLKAALTDLRFDYMRGYIPEEEYKTKEAELDSQLEDLDRQIAALK